MCSHGCIIVFVVTALHNLKENKMALTETQKEILLNDPIWPSMDEETIVYLIALIERVVEN